MQRVEVRLVRRSDMKGRSSRVVMLWAPGSPSQTFFCWGLVGWCSRCRVMFEKGKAKQNAESEGGSESAYYRRRINTGCLNTIK